MRCPYEGCEFDSTDRGVKLHHARSHDESLTEVTKPCTECGEDVTKQRTNFAGENQFCSHMCRRKYYSVEKVTKPCTECGDDITKLPCQFSAEEQFCSKACLGKYKSIKVTKSCTECGEDITKVPSQFSGENQFCSHECLGKYREGENNPSWAGGKSGIRQTPEYRDWRESVLLRDNYTCQDCGETGEGCELNAHHIVKLSENEELATDIDNGVTLCLECHFYRHKSYGDAGAARLISSHI